MIPLIKFGMEGTLLHTEAEIDCIIHYALIKAFCKSNQADKATNILEKMIADDCDHFVDAELLLLFINAVTKQGINRNCAI